MLVLNVRILAQIVIPRIRQNSVVEVFAFHSFYLYTYPPDSQENDGGANS